MAELKNTPKNRPAIVEAIERKKGPVHKGHSNKHRTNHLMEWLKEHGKK